MSLGPFSEALYNITNGARAPIIAHSFGTRLTGFALNDSEAVRIRTMILAITERFDGRERT